MASYNRSKLQQMMEQRRGAHLALRDMGERLRDARDDRERLKASIRSAAAQVRASPAFVDRMLALPLEEASRLPCAEVQGYERQSGNKLETYSTGINFDMFQKYLAARRKVDRLEQQYGAASADFEERFAIVSRLLDAVRAWGFRNPEMEL